MGVLEATRPRVRVPAGLVPPGETAWRKPGWCRGMKQSLNPAVPWTLGKRRGLPAQEGEGISPFSWWDVPAPPPTPALVYPRAFRSLLPSAPALGIPRDAAVPGQDHFPWITDSISRRNCCRSSGDKCSRSSREGSAGLGLHCP